MSAKGVGGPGGGDDGNSGLQQQIIELRSMVAQLAQNSAIENVVQQGFLQLSTQLEPLRDMSPRRDYPNTDAMERFTRIQRAIAQPLWRGTNFEAELPPGFDHCGRSG